MLIEKLKSCIRNLFKKYLFGENSLLEGISLYDERSSETTFNNNDGKTYASAKNIDKAIQYFTSANPNQNSEAALYLVFEK